MKLRNVNLIENIRDTEEYDIAKRVREMFKELEQIEVYGAISQTPLLIANDEGAIQTIHISPQRGMVSYDIGPIDKTKYSLHFGGKRLQISDISGRSRYPQCPLNFNLYSEPREPKEKPKKGFFNFFH